MSLAIRPFAPGDVGWTVMAHAEYYGVAWDLPASFECHVATELADLVERFDAARDGFWIATVDGARAGAIAIDGTTDPGWARLRFFICDAAHRGHGVGARLLDTALAFCKLAGHRDVYLTTFGGLDAARHLYERHGFVLVDERRERTWGRELTEQLFERRGSPAPAARRNR